MMVSKIPVLAFDVGQVDTLWDNHEPAIEWYEKHLAVVPSIRADKVHFRFDLSTTSEMMTFFPGYFNLHSIITSKRPVHLFAERGTVDPNIRLCFGTKNLEQEHAYLKAHNIRVTDIYKGAGDKSFFDIWATAEGTRFTAVGAPELPGDAPRYRDAFIRIGVSDLQASVQWYQQFLGFTHTEAGQSQEWIEMKTLCVENMDGQRVTPITQSYSIFLEKLPSNLETGRIDGPVRLYFLIENREEFDQYHQTLKDNGVWVSPIGDGFGTFHIYDPDGNRLNFWHY